MSFNNTSLNLIPTIIAGWVPNIKQVRSPHFNARPNHEISLLVIHNISLPPKVFGGEFVESFFLGVLNKEEHPYFSTIGDMKVSSHFLIKRTGKVIQFVSCLDRAWHAGVSSFWGRKACNDFSIGIELEGSDDVMYTTEQYESLSYLSVALMRSYPLITKDRIIGHCHIAPTRKTDPGTSFCWELFMKRIIELEEII